jgi:CheY-specific phosphatase CheX
MDKTSLTTAMTASISDVLETMFFLPIDISDAVKIEDLWPSDQSGMLAARLDFQGPISGHCCLFMPARLATDITADFLGQDPESIPDDQAIGTVTEIINMIVGNTFSLLDPQALFDLGIPKLESFEDNYAGGADQDQEIFIALDTLENRMALRMSFHIS